LPLEAVEEVLPALPIDPLPQCPDALRGVIFVRGRLIPVIDAAQRLGVARSRPLEPPIVSVRLPGGVVGIEVDEVLDLLDLVVPPALSTDASDSSRISIPLGRERAAGDATSQDSDRAGAMIAAVDVDGQTVRLLDAQRLAAPGLPWETFHATSGQH
jgi:chemotaxis signal transduction protein